MSESEFDKLQKKLVVLVLLAVLGSNTGVVLLNKSSPDMRADPFTGKDAELMRSKAMEAVDQMFAESEAASNKYRRECDKRVSSLEWQQKRNVKWIEDHKGNVQMFYNHTHRANDGSVVVIERR